MLLARALVTMESTLTLIDPHASMAELAEPILDDLRRVLQPSMRQLSQVWKKTKLDWLALALAIPESLPHLLAGLNLGDHDAPPRHRRRSDVVGYRRPGWQQPASARA